MAEYTPTTWVDDSAPGISATELNRMEAGIDAALAMTEKWQELSIPAANAWREVDLSGYGVAAGNVVWIMFRISVGGPLMGGARQVGSSLQRRTNLHGENGVFTVPVVATGANATIELYTGHTTNCKAYLVGVVGLA